MEITGRIFNDPVVRKHGRFHVVRDDLHVGGTKARHMRALFEKHDEIVYATPAEGGAQYALAACAKEAGKQATLFVAKRAKPHDRALEAKALGAKIYQVKPGYLAVVQARAKRYCEDTGAYYLPFGASSEAAIEDISAAASIVAEAYDFDEVWCAAGSGILTRSLCRAFPNAAIHAVQVGRELRKGETGRATLHISPHEYSYALSCSVEFPICPHYEAKAWEIMERESKAPRVLFWNVAGSARP